MQRIEPLLCLSGAHKLRYEKAYCYILCIVVAQPLKSPAGKEFLSMNRQTNYFTLPPQMHSRVTLTSDQCRLWPSETPVVIARSLTVLIKTPSHREGRSDKGTEHNSPVGRPGGWKQTPTDALGQLLCAAGQRAPRSRTSAGEGYPR